MSTDPAHVNPPSDYDIEEPPAWEPPRWLCDFARDDVYPFLNAHREAAKAALGRWLAGRAKSNEFLRQLDLLDVEQRRLRCLAKTEEAQQALGARIEDRVSLLSGAYHGP